ncbi:hypothetical protein PHET_00999 [Paragonimus heterotremus]|uniref:Uncharacterized protein n=1 Tax=Paragonimus heterotremus TaxID=100268 RepID=A0A8J4TEH9_9TREM|nr:hypothetical protein PHET_00999 [Paragonimus heterotremus]
MLNRIRSLGDACEEDLEVYFVPDFRFPQSAEPRLIRLLTFVLVIVLAILTVWIYRFVTNLLIHVPVIWKGN